MFCCYTQTPQFFNDICDEIRLFYNEKRIERCGETDTQNDRVLRHLFCVVGGDWLCRAEYYEKGVLQCRLEKEAHAAGGGALHIKKLQKRLMKQTIYELFKQYTGKRLPWGSLTGIRPTKLARELTGEMGISRAREFFAEEFDVSESKTALAFDIAHNQESVIASVGQNDVSVYIGIPFCVSRCRYCSFVPHDVLRANTMQNEYMDALVREMEYARPALAQKRVRAVYIGGGTPTALSEENMERLLQTANRLSGNTMEFTVEAGRPDTVTAGKLELLRQYGVNRISINPQTLRQETLGAIGRRHSVEDFFAAFGLARRYGFDTVNVDVILGLPDETESDMRHTIEGVAALEPENITVHTLAIKNSSAFARESTGHFCDPGTVAKMVDEARAELERRGYAPYYMYRQKYMNGNLENTGYTKKGHTGIYNIDNMEEAVSIPAFGAGAISKRIFDGEQRIERSANVKDVAQYIDRVEEMAERKRRLFGR